MRSLLSAALVAAVVHALPAREYQAEQPNEYDIHGRHGSSRPAEVSSLSAYDWPEVYRPKPSTAVKGHYAKAYGTSSSLAPSFFTKHSKPYVPKYGVATVTVIAPQATVTVTPDGNLWSPSHPFTGGHADPKGSCDSSSGPYASTSKEQTDNAFVHDGTYGSPAGGFYGSAGYPAGIADPIEHDGPIETLAPVVHWNVDTAPAENVIPVPVGHGCPQYYAQGGNTSQSSTC